MSAQSTPGPEDANAQARAWLTLLHSGEAADSDREAFSAWLSASPEHALAYEKVRRLWNDLPLIDGLEKAAPLSRARRVWTWRAWPAAALGLAACLLLGVGVYLYEPVERQSFATRIGEFRTVELSDGSEIVLGPGTKVEVAFSDRRRRVSLTTGQAYFDVAHEAARVFSVSAQDTEIRVLGTAFDVRRGAEQITVSVLRGRVQVADETPQATAVNATLERGQRVSADLEGALGAITTVDPDRALAWQGGRLTYVDAPFAEVVADLNRYLPERVTLADPAVGRLRVTASFDVRQYREILDAFAASNALQIREREGAIAVER
jgi:transmembrane sensor